MDLDFKKEFVEKILKEYSTKKIDEKLDLLLNKKNIQNPPAWLMSALKNDYRDAEQERYDEEPAEESGTPNSQIPSSLEGEGLPCVVEKITAQGKGEGDKILSTEKAIKAIKLIQDNLSACISPIPSRKRIRARERSL